MSESTRTVLFILLIALIALAGGKYLLRVSHREQGPRAGLFRMGIAIYLALGLGLGRQGLGVLDDRMLANLEPVLDLALGWTGLLFGLQFRLPRLRRYPPGFTLVSFSQALATMLVVGAVMAPALSSVFPAAAPEQLWPAVILLAAVGAISSPSATALAARKVRKIKSGLGRLVHYVSSTDPVLPLVAFSIATGFLRQGTLSLQNGLEAVAVSVLIGLVLGLLFYSFARHRHGENELIFFVLAFTVFSGGVASYLGLSSLFISAVIGATLANRLEISERVFRVLATRERPILIVFSVLVGASWDPGSGAVPALMMLLVLYLAARIAGKLGGMAVIRPVLGGRVESGSTLAGLALLGQGGMSIALVANYLLLGQGPVCSTAVTVALLAVVLFEALGAYAASVALEERKGAGQ
ncbi:MAG: cation:proton antiporter [Gemmatimonadota bacterium]|nr:cation:proton antiporter [Gemmatimonadota bacterium]